MLLCSLLSTFLLITVTLGSPVEPSHMADILYEKRQLGALGPILKGIMDQSPAPAPAPVPVPAPASVAPLPASPTAVEDCSDALRKINDALDMSEQFLKTSGNTPSIRDIQAVLGVLADSLDEDCKEDRRRDSEEQANGLAMGATQVTTIVPTAPNMRFSKRDSECSDCETQLYKIVKELQKILAMTHQVTTQSGIPSEIGNVASKTPTLPASPSITV